MNKELDLSRSVYELVKENPELQEILAGLGFLEIKKPAMLNSVAKVMTIPKGAKMKGIPMEKIVMTLMQKGFTLSGAMPASVSVPDAPAAAPVQSDSRTEQLKAYLRRLGAGEDLESVRADFAKEFGDVEASEI